MFILKNFKAIAAKIHALRVCRRPSRAPHKKVQENPFFPDFPELWWR